MVLRTLSSKYELARWQRYRNIRSNCTDTLMLCRMFPLNIHDTASCARAYQTRAGFHTPTHASNYLQTDGQLLTSGNEPATASYQSWPRFSRPSIMQRAYTRLSFAAQIGNGSGKAVELSVRPSLFAYKPIELDMFTI